MHKSERSSGEELVVAHSIRSARKEEIVLDLSTCYAVEMKEEGNLNSSPVRQIILWFVSRHQI